MQLLDGARVEADVGLEADEEDGGAGAVAVYFGDPLRGGSNEQELLVDMMMVHNLFIIIFFVSTCEGEGAK